MTNSFVLMDSWRPTALCRTYFSAHFEKLQAQVLAADGASREMTLNWAAGVLADGDWQALGAWPGAAVGSAFWHGVWEDFDSRGVENITLVCASEPEASSLFHGAKVLPPFGRILGQGNVPADSGVGVLRAEGRRAVREASRVRAARIALERLPVRARAGRAAVLSPDWPEVLEQFRPFYALRPHRRALVCAGDEYLEALGLSLGRAVARHGPFADLREAGAMTMAPDLVARTLRLHAAERWRVGTIAR